MSSKSTFSSSTSKSYALALFELAEENSALKVVEEEIKNINKLLGQNLLFNEMVLSPTIAKEDKMKVVNILSDQNNLSSTVKKFLGFLAIKNRLFFLKQIIVSFLNLVSNNKGELKAQLISSEKLSVEKQKKIQDELSKDLKSPLNIDYRHDPSLIAGVIIQIGSVMIDTSIKTKLKKLEKNMLEA